MKSQAHKGTERPLTASKHSIPRMTVTCKRTRGGVIRLKHSCSDEESKLESKLEERIPQYIDRLTPTQLTKDVIKVESRCEEPSDVDTDSEDDGWPTLLDVESKKKADVIADKIGTESDGEYKEELTEDKSEGVILLGDITQEKFVLRNIAYSVSLIEETAIRRGVKLSGSRLEFATTRLDEYARYVKLLRSIALLVDLINGTFCPQKILMASACFKPSKSFRVPSYDTRVNKLTCKL